MKRKLISFFKRKMSPQLYYILKKFYRNVFITNKLFSYITNYKNINIGKKLIAHIVHLKNSYKGFLIYPPTVAWNSLTQRNHHLLKCFADDGFIVFYLTPDPEKDGVHDFLEIENNIFLCSKLSYPSFNILLSFKKKILLFVHWTYNKAIAKAVRYDYLIYDYVDSLKLFSDYSKSMLKDHIWLVKNAELPIATAKVLFDEIKQLNDNALYCPNGCDYSHFHSKVNNFKIPEDIKQFVEKDKTIVGYFGALAEWIDYDLIVYLAEREKDMQFILIGIDYDKSISRYTLEDHNNISYLGCKSYNDLPDYLQCFTIAFIPFRKNEITDAVSPIKMYEYLAGNKVVVTTFIEELSENKLILKSHNYKEFHSNIKKAIELSNNSDYTRNIDLFAKNNTWNKRYEFIIKNIFIIFLFLISNILSFI